MEDCPDGGACWSATSTAWPLTRSPAHPDAVASPETPGAPAAPTPAPSPSPDGGDDELPLLSGHWLFCCWSCCSTARRRASSRDAPGNFSSASLLVPRRQCCAVRCQRGTVRLDLLQRMEPRPRARTCWHWPTQAPRPRVCDEQMRRWCRFGCLFFQDCPFIRAKEQGRPRALGHAALSLRSPLSREDPNARVYLIHSQREGRIPSIFCFFYLLID